MNIEKSSRKSVIIRCLSIILALCMLAGCGGNAATTKTDPNESSGPTEIRDTQTVTEEIPGEEATYRTEYEYDYYDDQYTTKPGQWVSSTTQRTVQNLSNYNFDENKYETAVYSGGTAVRTESFIRGMGMSQYHATEGWNISEATRALDDANFKELNVTSKRTWGESNSAVLSEKYSYVGTISVSSILDKAIFRDGNPAGHDYDFSDSNAVEKIINAWKEKFINPLIRKQNVFSTIGNEYRNNSTNKATGKYDISGYNESILSVFRNQWCKSRFGTIGKLNKLCGTSYNSFDDINATTGMGPLLGFEFWLFRRNAYQNTFREVISGMKKIYPDTKWGVAAIASDSDIYGVNSYLDFLDYTSCNLYWTWWSDFSIFSYQLDNLTAWSKTAPVVITEIGIPNGETDESMALAVRRNKQFLPMLYMRPRVVGSYIFNYTNSNNPDAIENTNTWGVVKNDRTRYPAFDAVAQIYTDFKYLDKYYNGASNTPLVALSSRLVDEKTTGSVNLSSDLASLLSSQGVPIQVVPSDDAERFETLSVNRLIYNDIFNYQSPNGSNDVGKALESYLSGGNKILRTSNTSPKPLYDIGTAFSDSSYKKLQNRYSNLQVSTTSTNDKEKMWKVAADFIHGDFVSGKISPTKNKIDENAVRILEVKGYDIKALKDPTWDIQAQMVYKNGEMYLCVVNTGDEIINKVDITIGVNKGVKCNLTPRLMRGDANVSVYRPERANVPSYVENVKDSKVQFGTISIENLDTYAFIHVGKAVQ